MQVAEIRGRLLSDVEKLKAPEEYLYAGYPNFDTLFGRDALITGWQMLRIDPSIAKATLYWLAQYQAKRSSKKADRQPGKILHVLQGTMPGQQYPYYGSVDATPLFVIVADQYFQATKDREFLISIWDNIVRAVTWIHDYGTGLDHLIEYERKAPSGNYHQSWMDDGEDHLGITSPVAIVEAQGYSYAAYLSGVNLIRELDTDNSFSPLWLGRAKRLREAFHKSFWWEDESCYYQALDGSKKPKESVSSNFGHLFFTGIIPEEVIGRLVKRIFERDICTPYGIRTLSDKDENFDSAGYHLGSVWPHDNWIIYHGLRQLGFIGEAKRLKEAAIRAYEELGGAHELFRVKDGQIFSLAESAYLRYPGRPGYANRLQAWATCGLLNMLWED